LFKLITAVAAGGALGAICRYVVFILSQQIWGLKFPYGTLLVNSSGSFLIGFLLIALSGRWGGSDNLRLFLLTGFLGAYTTFSSFAAESLLLFEHQQWFKLLANILLNNLFAFIAVFAGWQTAKWLLSH
jgi:CrcB protein